VRHLDWLNGVALVIAPLRLLQAECRFESWGGGHILETHVIA